LSDEVSNLDGDNFPVVLMFARIHNSTKHTLACSMQQLQLGGKDDNFRFLA